MRFSSPPSERCDERPLESALTGKAGTTCAVGCASTWRTTSAAIAFDHLARLAERGRSAALSTHSRRSTKCEAVSREPCRPGHRTPRGKLRTVLFLIDSANSDCSIFARDAGSATEERLRWLRTDCKTVKTPYRPTTYLRREPEGQGSSPVSSCSPPSSSTRAPKRFTSNCGSSSSSHHNRHTVVSRCG